MPAKLVRLCPGSCDERVPRSHGLEQGPQDACPDSCDKRVTPGSGVDAVVRPRRLAARRRAVALCTEALQGAGVGGAQAGHSGEIGDGGAEAGCKGWELRIECGNNWLPLGVG